MGHRTPTRPEVHSGVDFFYRATLEEADPRSICGEEHHVVAQVRPEQLVKVTQVVVVTSEITAIFILHLTKHRNSKWGMLFMSYVLR